MKRSELIDRIIAGTEYLERQDISPEQEDAARSKLEKYRQQLRDMDEAAEEVQLAVTAEETPETHPLIEDNSPKSEDERISESRQAIRDLLAILNK